MLLIRGQHVDGEAALERLGRTQHLRRHQVLLSEQLGVLRRDDEAGEQVPQRATVLTLRGGGRADDVRGGVGIGDALPLVGAVVMAVVD